MVLRIVVVLVVLAALVGAWWLLQILGMPASLSPDALSEWLKSQGNVGPLLLILLMVIAVIAVVVGLIPTLPVSATVWGAHRDRYRCNRCTDWRHGRILDRPLPRAGGDQQAFPGWPGIGTRWFTTLSDHYHLADSVDTGFFICFDQLRGRSHRNTRFALATLVGMLPMTIVFAGLGNTFTLHPVWTVIAGLAILAVMVWLPWSTSRHPDSRLAHWLKLR